MQTAIPRLAIAILCGLLWCSPITAGDGPAPRAAEGVKSPVQEPVETTPKRVEESQPSLFYLKDKRGALQAVPNFTLEDFEELYKLKHQLAQGDQRPKYSLQQMSATGSVGSGGFAELSIRVRILVREEQWTRVPLRLDEAVLREPAQYEGKGEQFLHFEGEGEGYVVWLRGPAGQQHQLTLKMLVPLTTAGEETRLRLLLPRATASELKLKVPIAGAAGKVSEGATLQTAASGASETELTVIGPGGDFELAWYRSGARVAEVPTVLEASGTVSARIDSRGADSEATLSVRSYGASFDRFRVRLPVDAELVPGNPANYAVAVVEPSSPGGARQQVVEVRLSKRTSGPVEVRLATNRAYDATKPDAWLELAGFEVVGAARQWGTIAVSAVGDWQVLWGPSRGVRQIDPLPEPLRRKDVAAGFDYFVQPYSLMTRLVQKKTRINVEPEYLLLVDSDQVRLDAKLRYTVRGAKVYALELTMPDWQLDEVGPDSLVAVDGVPPGGTVPTFSIPLTQPSIGQFEVRIRAHRSLPADAHALSLTLPQPQASAPASAVVVIVPADNVELIPSGKGMHGLLRQQTAVPMELPPRQQEPLYYRSEAAQSVFAAELRRHAQRIAVDAASQVNLDGSNSFVDEKLTYTIAYEPTDHFTLDVPRSLMESGRLELKHDDQVLVPTTIEEPGDAARTVPVRVTLPKARIGPCELTAHYPLALPKISTEQRTEVDIPLVMPGEGDLTGCKLVVASSPELRVEPRPGAWTAMETGVLHGGPRRGLQLTATRRCDQVELDVQSEPGSESAVVVDRAWIQTWITGLAQTPRQDRAVYQFASRGRELEITLPERTSAEQVCVMLDGKRAAPTAAADGRLLVPLAADGAANRHLLDLRYPVLGPRSKSFDFPRLGNDVWIRRMYWQVVLPRGEHVVSLPDELTGEYRWGWSGYFWGRQPLLDQAQLESWIGVRTSVAAVPATANRYLYGALGPVSRCELRTASRAGIVLGASGAALLVGLLLIYFPRARHPASLLTAPVLLASLGIMVPEPAILGAQAAALGLVLALMAGLLSHMVVRWRRAPAPAERVSSVTAVVSLPAGNHLTGSVSVAAATQIQSPPMSSDVEP